MRVLVACEFSGLVRDAFASRGHDAWSCDLLQSERPGNHHVGDVVPLLTGGWDLMIAHPPCTFLCSSGARWWSGRRREQDEALEFVRLLMNADIGMIALENPIGRIGTQVRPADQIIQPWWFGHGESKSTCLWLKNLPDLEPTNIVACSSERIHRMSQSSTRSKERSRTYHGIAKAMAEQWG